MRFAGEGGAPLAAPSASLARRALALTYEALLLTALLLAAALPFVIMAHAADAIAARPLFQVYLIVVAGAYFVWQWRRGGQTLPMKACASVEKSRRSWSVNPRNSVGSGTT